MSSVLVCQSLKKRFDDQVVLEDVTFTLRAGQTVALLGPSGCGKSTLLNIVAGLLRADGGSLSLGDDLLDSVEKGVYEPAHRRNFAMVFQDFSLWPHMTVEENVAYGLKVRKVARPERKRRVVEALDQVEMGAFAHRYPAQLSGGQQQRVAIARAIVVRPRLLLMDEPLSALDARLRDELRDTLALLLARTSTSTLYVTHDQAEAFALASEVAVMNGGRIEQFDTPQGLYQNPRTPFVAAFIGSNQILALFRRAGAWQTDAGTAIPDSWLPQAGRSPKFTEGWGLIRRESVRVRIRGEGELLPTDALPAICCSSRFMGDGYEIRTQIEPGLELKGLCPTVVQPGAQVVVRLEPESLHWVGEEQTP